MVLTEQVTAIYETIGCRMMGVYLVSLVTCSGAAEIVIRAYRKPQRITITIPCL